WMGTTIAAAGLFTELDGLVQAHLVGIGEEYRHLSPLKVLLDDARRWARERGAHALHLGGGRGGQDDSLLAFKSRFSDRRHVFHTGRWILDEQAYRELAAARPGAAAHSTDFFPAYRAPLPEGQA